MKFIPLELFVFNDFIKSMIVKRQKSLLIHNYTKSILSFVTSSHQKASEALNLSLCDINDRFEEHVSWLAELDTLTSERIKLRNDIKDLLEKQLSKNRNIKVDLQLLAELQAFVPLFKKHFESVTSLADEFCTKYEPLEIFLNFLDLRALIAVVEQLLEDSKQLDVLKDIQQRKDSADVLIRGLSTQLSTELQSQLNFAEIARKANEEFQKILADVEFRNH